MKTTALTVATLALGALGLAACSSGSTAEESVASAPSASASLVGGTAVCDEASLRSAIEASFSESGDDMQLMRINEFECSDGWAVVFPDVGTNEEDAVTVTEVLQAEGQFWLVKDRNDVCGTIDMNAPDQRPDDSQVPADIWVASCNTN